METCVELPRLFRVQRALLGRRFGSCLFPRRGLLGDVLGYEDVL
jgi:hypothetical protein